MVIKGSLDSTSAAACLMALRDVGSGTVSELASVAGLSRPTLEAALVKLARTGLVEHRVESVLPHLAGGRPARVSRFRPDAGYVAGVDLIGTTVKVALADLSGQWVHTGPTDFPAPTTRKPSLDPVVSAVHAALDSAGLTLEQLKAVGVGTSGVAAADGSMVTSPFVRPWAGTDVGRQLSDRLGTPVVIDNDLTLAAMAESRMGALRDVEVGIYAETFHNMSARTVIDGRVVRGRHRAAGELGVLRAFTSMDHVLASYFDDVKKTAETLTRVRAGEDTKADRAERDTLVASMAAPLAALTLALDPDAIVLGGALGRYADELAPHISKALPGLARGGPTLEPRIVGATYVDEGILVGAIDQAFALHPVPIYGVDRVTPPRQTLLTDDRDAPVAAHA